MQTSTTRQRTAPRWALVFLAALVAVLTIVGLAATSASATAAGVAETRVRASSAAAEVPVGPPPCIGAGQRLGNESAEARLAAGAGVHTYHVGTQGILVHNTCGPLKTREFDEFGNRITNAAPATRAQTDDLAAYLGYSPTGRLVQNQMVYRSGRNFIVQDRTWHNGGFWKMGRSVDDLRNRTTRSGTYDFLLQYIGK